MLPLPDEPGFPSGGDGSASGPAGTTEADLPRKGASPKVEPEQTRTQELVELMEGFYLAEPTVGHEWTTARRGVGEVKAALDAALDTLWQRFGVSTKVSLSQLLAETPGIELAAGLAAVPGTVLTSQQGSI